MRCLQCGNEIPTGHKFCHECGATAPETLRICPFCQAGLPPGMRFCPHCGQALAPVAPSAAPAGAPVAPNYPAQAPPTNTPPRRGTSWLVPFIAAVAVTLLVAGGFGAWWYTDGIIPGQPVAATAPAPTPAQVAAVQATIPPTSVPPTPTATAIPPTPTPPPTATPVPTRPPTATPTNTPVPAPKLGAANASKPATDRMITSDLLGEAPANQVMVLLAEGQNRQVAERVAAELGGKIVGEVEYISLYQIETEGVSEEDLQTALDLASSLEGVEESFPNQIATRRDIPCMACNQSNDPTLGGDVWRHYNNIGYKRAWDLVKASGVKLNDVQVGVIDEARFVWQQGYGDAQVNGLGANDVRVVRRREIAAGWHGVNVTNFIAGDPKNGGITGIASPLGKNLKVAVSRLSFDKNEAPPNPDDPTQMTGDDGKTYTLNILADINRQIEGKSRVINCSWGSASLNSNTSKKWSKAFRRYLNKVAKDHPDVLFVAAAGNTKENLDGSNDFVAGQPLPNVVTVGGIDKKGDPYDSFGAGTNRATGEGEVTIAAPAQDVAVDVQAGQLNHSDGTSYAAPQVSAAAAVIMSINPKLSAKQVKDILANSAAPGVTDGNTSVPLAPGLGKGVLRLDKAVVEALNTVLPKEKQLDPQQIELLGQIQGSAKLKKIKEYTIAAKLEAVAPAGTDVKLELRGKGATVTGQPSQKLSKPGEVTWDLTLTDPTAKPVARVCRLDTDTCCEVTIEIPDVQGTWKGTMTITNVEVADDVPIPDPLDPSKPPGVIKKADCENLLEASMNQPRELTIELKANNPFEGTGTVTTLDEKGKASVIPDMQYTFDGEKLSLSGAAQGTQVRFSGVVTGSGDKLQLKGTFTMGMSGNQNQPVLSISGSFDTMLTGR